MTYLTANRIWDFRRQLQPRFHSVESGEPGIKDGLSLQLPVTCFVDSRFSPYNSLGWIENMVSHARHISLKICHNKRKRGKPKTGKIRSCSKRRFQDSERYQPPSSFGRGGYGIECFHCLSSMRITYCCCRCCCFFLFLSFALTSASTFRQHNRVRQALWISKYSSTG